MAKKRERYRVQTWPIFKKCILYDDQILVNKEKGDADLVKSKTVYNFDSEKFTPRSRMETLWKMPQVVD